MRLGNLDFSLPIVIGMFEMTGKNKALSLQKILD